MILLLEEKYNYSSYAPIKVKVDHLICYISESYEAFDVENT